MVDIKKWQDRIENLLQVQKDLCLEQINTTFTRNELIELRLLLNEMMEIKNNNRATAVTVAESEEAMMDMEKINYKEEAENWIANEGPMDMADILVDVLESDAFEGNSYYDKLYYADNLARELRKYE